MTCCRVRRLILSAIFIACFLFFPLFLHYHIPIDDRKKRVSSIKVAITQFTVPKKEIKFPVTEVEAPTTEVTDPTTEITVPTSDATIATPRKCEISNDDLFPFCASKVDYLQYTWKQNEECFVKKHGLIPEDLCSILTFLSEVEYHCPRQPWRPVIESKKSKKKAVVKYDIEGLNDVLKEKRYGWMRNRISRWWPFWKNGTESYVRRNQKVGQHQVKDIFVFMGSYAFAPAWFDFVDQGVPLGEMVQWTDLITSLYILGHNLTICSDLSQMKSLLKAPDLSGCADKNQPDLFDVVYTDLVGNFMIRDHLGPNYHTLKCKLRMLDSFGTEAEFNFASYGGKIPGGRSPWGNGNFFLKQLFTFFPHSPDNNFLGFVVGAPVPEDAKPLPKKPIGVVYGKEPSFWKNKRDYLDVLSKYVEIHATVGDSDFTPLEEVQEDSKRNVPDYVKMHGILNATELVHLLQQAKVFIGLGFPYEGPAPLEAIAQGCVFLNGKLDPPHNRLNTEFFKIKPTLRELTSQHPYAEMAIGKPYVYTLNLSDTNSVENAMKEIMSTEVKPYLPFEWTPEGMLERVHVFNEKLNFCDHSSERWPPLQHMQKFLGTAGQSCQDVCLEHGLLCEPSYFRDLNSVAALEALGATCTAQSKKPSLLAPSFNPLMRSCVLQAQPLLYSCVARDPGLQRLCPCRDYQPQQVALCKNCG